MLHMVEDTRDATHGGGHTAMLHMVEDTRRCYTWWRTHVMLHMVEDTRDATHGGGHT